MTDAKRGRAPMRPAAATPVAPIAVTAPRRPRVTSLADPNLGTFGRAGDEVLAGLRGFFDVASVGLADPVWAAAKATIGGAPAGWVDRFRGALQREQELDRLDAARHGGARAFGQVAGAIAPAFIPGVGLTSTISGAGRLAGLAKAGRLASNAKRFAMGGRLRAGRLPESTVGHILNTSMTTGALSGAAAQVVEDTLRRRYSSPADMISATAGGAIGGLAAPFTGAAGGGAVTGAATESLNAILNGELLDPADIRMAALSGAAAGQWGAVLPTKYVEKLGSNSKTRSQMKGAFGEKLSRLNADLRGETVLREQKPVPLSDYTGKSGYTRVDTELSSPFSPSEPGRLVESKMGPRAKLERRQRQALREGVPNYWVEHWMDRDPGDILGNALAGLSTPLPRLGISTEPNVRRSAQWGLGYWPN